MGWLFLHLSPSVWPLLDLEKDCLSQGCHLNLTGDWSRTQIPCAVLQNKEVDLLRGYLDLMKLKGYCLLDQLKTAWPHLSLCTCFLWLLSMELDLPTTEGFTLPCSSRSALPKMDINIESILVPGPVLHFTYNAHNHTTRLLFLLHT